MIIPLIKILGRLFGILLGLILLLVVMIVLGFAWVDETNGSLVSSGEEREYLLYIPPSVNPTTPAPLVISIHGFAEWPAHQRDVSRWNELADRHGFIVVYPSGTGFPKRWRISGEVGISDDLPIDVQFISDLIDRLQQEYNIDARRIYANGLSNGGGMSALLGCELSERIAAVGSVSGAYLTSPKECDFTRSVPLIAFHGTADTIVPYFGGASRMSDIHFSIVPDWISAWATKNGCVLPPVALSSSGDVSGVRFTQCGRNMEVVFYSILGGGHAWPGGEPLPEWIVGQTTQQINATELMWQFFSQYKLEP